MFNSARLKLTLWYLVILMAISWSFSLAIYRVLTNEVIRFAQQQRFRLERDFTQNQVPRSNVYIFPAPAITDVDLELIRELRSRLLFQLVMLNLGIGVVAGGLAYWLAGRTLEPIQEMVEDQNRFVSDSSHELRTPITSLKTSLEVSLRDPKLSATEARELLQENLDDVNRLEALVDNLLQLSPHRFNRPLEYEALNLDKIVTAAIKQVKPLAKNKNIPITKVVDDVSFTADQKSLLQLLVILLDNAIKYSPESQPIHVSSQIKRSQIVLMIEDHGMGIEADELPHIFDRFYRSDEARTRSGSGGYGLGLAIAHRIVNQHRGKITVTSQIHRGTTFTVNLPKSQKTNLS